MKRLSVFEKWLALFVAFIIAMIFCRVLYSDSKTYVFLLWNLFLAWVPFKISALLAKRKLNKNWLSILLFGSWFLFFPNALYIITDLIHLKQRQNIPIWYDAVLLFTSSTAGLLLAFASLYNVEVFLKNKFRHVFVTILVFVFLLAGSFGVYLGRFLRWNSWDIITAPIQLAEEIFVRFLFPVQHYRTWGVTVLLMCLFSLLYFGVRNIGIKPAQSRRHSH